MKKYRKTEQWVLHALTIAMFMNYYYAVGVLCWAIIAPDQGSFINTFQHGGFRVNALYWGGLLGCNLCFSGLSSALFNAGNGLKKPLLPITIKKALDVCICAGFIVVPLLVIKSNLAIRANIHPLFLMVLTAIFLITMTHRYLQIQRTYSKRKGLARA